MQISSRFLVPFILIFIPRCSSNALEYNGRDSNDIHFWFVFMSPPTTWANGRAGIGSRAYWFVTSELLTKRVHALFDDHINGSMCSRNYWYTNKRKPKAPLQPNTHNLAAGFHAIPQTKLRPTEPIPRNERNNKKTTVTELGQYVLVFGGHFLLLESLDSCGSPDFQARAEEYFNKSINNNKMLTISVEPLKMLFR